MKTDKKGKALPTREALDKMKMAIPVTIDGQALIGSKKQFKKGSVGYNTSGKIIIDGVVCQVSCNIVAVGSKELAKSEGFVEGEDDSDNDEYIPDYGRGAPGACPTTEKFKDPGDHFSIYDLSTSRPPSFQKRFSRRLKKNGRKAHIPFEV